jgi:hypothetical protein
LLSTGNEFRAADLNLDRFHSLANFCLHRCELPTFSLSEPHNICIPEIAQILGAKKGFVVA